MADAASFFASELSVWKAIAIFVRASCCGTITQLFVFGSFFEIFRFDGGCLCRLQFGFHVLE